MLTDIDKEFDTPVLDENGEPIEVIEIEEVFGDVNNQEPIEQENYEGIENDIVQEGVEEEQVNVSEEIIVEGKENYNNAKEQLVAIFTSILEVGEITAEDNVIIQQIKEQYTQAYNDVKENTENVKKKTLEERLQELTDGMVGATTDDILNILTEGGTKCWLYKDDDGNVLMDGTSIPELTLLVQKLNLIATDGEDESSIVLTPLLIQLIAESDIQLSAKKILINGLLEGAGWRISEEGDLDINDLNIRGTLSCKNMNVDNLISAGIANCLSETLDIHIISGQTISQYLDDIPLNLNGYSVNIYLDADTTENLEIRRHMNGIVNIYLCGHSIKGTIRGNFNNSIYNIYGGSTSEDTVIGEVMPYIGYNIGSYYYSVVFINCPNVNLCNIKVYGDKVNVNTVGIGGQQKSKIEMENITFVGCKYNVRTYSMAEIYCNSSNGISTGNSFSAGTGSKIYLGATTQAGGGDNVYTSNNGQIFSEGAIFSTTATGDSNTSSSGTTTTRVETFKPNYADTYRTGKYFTWKQDGVCRQGDWGYGYCNGCWFYGTQFAEAKGKNITKVVISVSRSSGVGNSGSVSHVFQAHTHSSRPSGMPDYTTCNKSLSLAWGESGTVTITDSVILAGIKAGDIKGFGIKSAYDSNHYSALTNGTVKIYYTE